MPLSKSLLSKVPQLDSPKEEKRLPNVIATRHDRPTCRVESASVLGEALLQELSWSSEPARQKALAKARGGEFEEVGEV